MTTEHNGAGEVQFYGCRAPLRNLFPPVRLCKVEHTTRAPEDCGGDLQVNHTHWEGVLIQKDINILSIENSVCLKSYPSHALAPGISLSSRIELTQ